MRILVKSIDLLLFTVFLGIAVVAPLMDAQTCLPLTLYPDVLINLKQWYTEEFDDYLYKEKPSFFVGLIWFQIFFQWPLSLINLYGILGSKSWFPTTCLILGSSIFTSVAAISAELIGSGKASDKMLMMYLPFLGFGALAILRGLLVPATSKKASQSAMARKKKA